MTQRIDCIHGLWLLLMALALGPVSALAEPEDAA